MAKYLTILKDISDLMFFFCYTISPGMVSKQYNFKIVITFYVDDD